MFSNLFSSSPTPTFSNNNIFLRFAQKNDYKEWSSLRLKNMDYLAPFEPKWHKSDLSESAFIKRLFHYENHAKTKTEFQFFIFLQNKGIKTLVGAISLSNIRYNAARHVTLGYWVSEEESNKGIISKSVKLILPFIFNSLQLVRVHAACLPHNIASRKLLEKNGFEEEGYSKDYLQINGIWQDHVLYALTREKYLSLNTCETNKTALPKEYR
ncbi:MAG: GNAT family N-acetyltransferase [Devosiaceae bacterium]|nr:GNAT family N-acetyltransferase [Devosiaceae bacterium]